MKNNKLFHELKFIFAVISVSFSEYFLGCSFIFSSILMIQLNEPTSPVKLNADEASWIASVSSLVSPFGLLIIGILTDKIGRKKSFQLSYVLITVSWLILAYADSYETILIGRIVVGTTFGSSACSFVYVAEICTAARRQLFYSAMFLSVGIGMLTECAFAKLFRWHTVSAIFAAMSAAGLAALSALPESPVWLRSRGRRTEAERAERWFGLDANRRDQTPTADEDGSANCCARTPPAAASSPLTCWSTYTSRTVWIPTLITVSFVACQQGCGLYVIIFYAADVLRDFRVARWDALDVSLFMSVSRVLGSVAFTLMHRVQRKTLAVVSFVGMSASLIAIAVYAKAFGNADRPPCEFVLVVAFVTYMFFSLLGALPMPWTICSEVFPTYVTGTMNGIVQTIGFLMMFAVLKMYPTMVSNFGIEYVWLVFTIICVVSVFFCAFILPETKGIPLKDILATFEVKNKKNVV